MLTGSRQVYCVMCLLLEIIPKMISEINAAVLITVQSAPSCFTSVNMLCSADAGSVRSLPSQDCCDSTGSISVEAQRPEEAARRHILFLLLESNWNPAAQTCSQCCTSVSGAMSLHWQFGLQEQTILKNVKKQLEWNSLQPADDLKCALQSSFNVMTAGVATDSDRLQRELRWFIIANTVMAEPCQNLLPKITHNATVVSQSCSRSS